MNTSNASMPHCDANEVVQKLSRRLGLLRADESNDLLRKECIELALQAGDYTQSESLARNALVRRQDDSGARFQLTNALIGKREYEAAIVELKTLLDTDLRKSAQSNLALCYYMLGLYLESANVLEKMYEAGDRETGTMRLLLSSLHHLGEIDRAVEIANRSDEAALTDGPTAGVYALLYLDADLPDKARRYATIALERNPDSIDGLTAQATVRGSELDATGATQLYERVLELAPANGRAWIGLGAMSLLKQDFPTARSQIRRGLESLPDHVGSWVVLGWTELLQSDLDAAESAFNKALSLDRNFSEVHGALASIAAMRGRNAEARHLIDIALKLDPACMGAIHAQAVLAGAAGNADAAKKLIRDAMTKLGARNRKQFR